MGATLVLLLLLCAATSAAAAQHKNSKIPVPSSLSPGTNSSVWLSPSGKFAFGFYDTPNGYAVCIFLAGFSDKTVVWTANKIGPMLPNNVYSLEINDYKGLVLWQYRNGGDYIYDPIASPEEHIEWGSMLDNGNFVLYNSKGRVIWQSFDNPTGALLPGQRLLPGRELFSSASETDPSIGLFRLKMQRDGNLVQYPVNTPDTDENAYFASGTYGAGRNVSLNLGNDGRLYLSNGDDEIQDITSGGSEGPTIYLARVDPDGIFRLYNRSLDGEGNWTTIWASTDDRCDPRGICGVNSFCSSYQINVNVECTCLPGFRDSGAGCHQDFNVQDCRDKNPSVRYEMRAVENVTWEDNYYAAMNDKVTQVECGRACLDDCDCVVALFSDGNCRKQRSPIRYGRMSSDTSMALVRVALPALTLSSPIQPPDASDGKPEPPDASGKHVDHQFHLPFHFCSSLALRSGKGIPGSKKGISDMQKYTLIGVSIGISLLVISSLIIYYLRRKGGFCGQDEESKQNVNKLVLDHGSLAPKRYTYKEIKKITNTFTERLGRGGYGIVYKGKLPDGQLVAVKVLTKTHGNADEFVNEVASISRTSHINIVNLLGFCFERKKRALIYEFMPNKSLDKFIYKSGSVDAECSLEWRKLYEIAVGVARGLEYLHRGCNTRIVHFDIKPQNILLDQDFCPKISDFGLAKLCMRKQSVISMLGTRGTIGYIAPEVFSRNFGVVSHKSDVYSYGIMLLQMAEARTNVEVKSFQTSENFFLEDIYKHVLVQNEKVCAVITEEEEEAVKKMLMVGFWCIQTAPTDRPSMNNVVDMLEGNLQCIEIPPLPFLLSSPKPQSSCLLPVIVESPRST
ncbi:PR5-like receptor kinase [Perilla frutescens var. frutescens]|nr:PR5-like receptor kinase [Perilla frutescens var. frutescens]